MGEKHSYFIQKNSCWLLKLLPASKFTPAFRVDGSFSSACFAANHGFFSWFLKIPSGGPDASSGNWRNANASIYMPQFCPLRCSLGPLCLQAQKHIISFCLSSGNMRGWRQVHCSVASLKSPAPGVSCTQSPVHAGDHWAGKQLGREGSGVLVIPSRSWSSNVRLGKEGQWCINVLMDNGLH